MLTAAYEFTIYSQPIELRYGQVYNKMQWEGDGSDQLLPEDVRQRYSGEKKMAIRGFTADMVRKLPDGSEMQVMLNDHYLHHYILYFGENSTVSQMVQAASDDHELSHMMTGCHGMKGMGLRMHKHRLLAEGKPADVVSFGSASGAEYRHNPQRFEAPYRLIVERPEVWAPTFHIINTKDDPRTVSPLLECPCTPQRQIDPTHGTVDGRMPDPPFGCSSQFAATRNPSCNLSTYVGGWRCCEHHMFLVDTSKECLSLTCAEKPSDRVFMKFTFSYEDATPQTRNIEAAACCDTTGFGQVTGNIEHDVPACPEGTVPEECIYVTESVQPVAYTNLQGDTAC